MVPEDSLGIALPASTVGAVVVVAKGAVSPVGGAIEARGGWAPVVGDAVEGEHCGLMRVLWSNVFEIGGMSRGVAQAEDRVEGLYVAGLEVFTVSLDTQRDCMVY